MEELTVPADDMLREALRIVEGIALGSAVIADVARTDDERKFAELVSRRAGEAATILTNVRTQRTP